MLEDSEEPGTTNENRLGWRRQREKYIQQHGRHKVQIPLERCVAYKLVLVKKDGRKMERYAVERAIQAQFPGGLAVGAGIGGSATAFLRALSRNTAYEYGAWASSAPAARNFTTTTLHTSMIRARCSAANVGAVWGLRS